MGSNDRKLDETERGQEREKMEKQDGKREKVSGVRKQGASSLAMGQIPRCNWPGRYGGSSLRF